MNPFGEGVVMVSPHNKLEVYPITLVPSNLLQATVIAMGIPSPALPFDWIQKLGRQLS